MPPDQDIPIETLAADANLPAMEPIDPTHLGTHPSLLHSGLSVRRFYAMHVQSAIFPVTAGALLYGWRGLLVLGAVLLSTVLAIAIWRRIGSRGQTLRYSPAIWLALLLGLMLPPHLASARSLALLGEAPLWPILPAAGIALAGLIWALGGVGSGRIHPALMVYLLIVVLFRGELVPHWTLQRERVLVGDVLDAPTDRPLPFRDDWARAPLIFGTGGAPAQAGLFWRQPASQQLLSLTSVSETPDQPSLTLEGLIRDRMPPLEDLVIGGHPGPLGASSAIAVIIGGLFLLYRGLIDYRIPLLVVLAAYLAFLLMPIPTSISDGVRQWHWLYWRQPHVGWATAVTFVNYEILAGPLLLVAFFLATAPAIRPMARRARVLYAVLIGILTAFFQLYFFVSFGPYLALFVASLLTPPCDKLFAPRPLV